MPYFLNKNQKQFTTEQANESRMRSNIQRVVESTNSLLKQKLRAIDATVQKKEVFPIIESILELPLL